MDITEVIFAVFDFLKLAIPMAVLVFVIYKALAPVKNWLSEKYNLSWMKSVVLLNFIIIFGFLALFYLYFAATGALKAAPIAPELEYTLGENALLLAIGLVRVLIASVILTLALLFFEFIASLAMDSKIINIGAKNVHSKKHGEESASIVMQFFGVLVTVVIFLILFLFVFQWVPLGLVVFMFYGGVKEIPLLLTGFL